MDLRIDQEFASRIPPLTDEEFRQLEDNILADGIVINPIIVWKGVIVDGHNRFRILEQHPHIKYSVHEKSFDDRFAVLAWICKNQLGRRNLTPDQKKYLVGKQFEAEKQRQGTKNQYVQAKSEKCQIGTFQNPLDTAERIAKENGIGRRSVYRAEAYSKAVDMADEVEPGIRSEILSGNIKATAKDVEKIIQATTDERSQLIEKLRCSPPTKKEPSSDKAKIQEISEGLTKSRGKATQADMLYELDDALNSLIFRWNICLATNSSYVADKECYAQIQQRVQTGLAYLYKIKNGEMPT